MAGTDVDGQVIACGGRFSYERYGGQVCLSKSGIVLISQRPKAVGVSKSDHGYFSVLALPVP